MDELDQGPERRALPSSADEHGLRIDRLLAQRCPEFRAAIFSSCCRTAPSSWAAGAGQGLGQGRVGDAVEVELRPTAQAMAFQPEGDGTAHRSTRTST